MKRIALFAAAVLLLAPQLSAGPWLTSLSAAQKKAKVGKSLIFVDLFAEWCGWCHQLEQQVFPSQAFQKATDGYVLLRLNTEDRGEGTKLAQQFAITSLPTSLLLTGDLQIAGMIRGFQPADAFAKSIVELDGKYKDFRKRVAGEASIASDYPKRLDLAKEYRAHFALSQAESRFKKLATDEKAPGAVRDQAYFELALTQVMERKLDDALKTIDDFGKVQDKGDSYEQSYVLSAQIYAQKGNYLGAVNQLKSFKTKFPNSPLRANAEILLAQLEHLLNGSRVQ